MANSIGHGGCIMRHWQMEGDDLAAVAEKDFSFF